MLGFPLDMWRNLRHALPSHAWLNFVENVRDYHDRAEPDATRFGIASAVYWLAADYGGSEHDSLRIAANLTEYEPGAIERKPSCFLGELLYETTADQLDNEADLAGQEFKW